MLSSLILSTALGATPMVPRVEFEKYQLSNGLEVILHENHATPVVAVNVWYHVGSKNEQPRRTGFAHLFEHMMFQGSKHWDDDFFKPLQEIGATLNGSTNTDRTNYWEVVPANYVELALWLEADRMGFLLDAMTQAKLDNQRDVVKNERRQNYENRPYGYARGLIVESLYPPGHPYSWLTIGSQEDLTAATLDDVKSFYRAYYSPSNATLVVAGDFKAADLKALIEKQFGGLPPGPPVTRHQEWTPRLDGKRRIIAQDRVQLPRLYLVWPSTPYFAPDDGALDLLAAVLGDGKNSRLYKALVYEQQIAQDVSVAQSSAQIAGTFQITATARAGHSLAEIENAIDRELHALLGDRPITKSELSRVQDQLEAGFVRGLQQVGGFNGIADRLNLYNHFIGDPDFFEKDLQRWLSPAPTDLARVAALYLKPERLALEMQPMPEWKPSTSATAVALDRAAKPTPSADPSVKLPRLERRRLANGLELVVVEKRGLPLIEFNLVVRAGSASDPSDSPGLAVLCASMLDEGTTKHTSLELADRLERIGATLSFFVEPDSSGATLSVLTKHATAAVALFGEILAAPSFAPDELERVRKQNVTRLLQERDQPQAIANRATLEVLYGGSHPYGHPENGDEVALNAITREAIVEFHQRYWRPNNATLLVVGDIDASAAASLLEPALVGWKSAPVETAVITDPGPLAGISLHLIDRPGMTQSVVTVAAPGQRRSIPDYFPTAIMNTALGGMFSSRLNLNLREDKGYTYGARSSFDFRLAAGPFTASASVQTKFTAASITEILKELSDARGPRPLSAEEIEFARGSIVRGFPRGFETADQIAARLRDVVLFGLPDDYFDRYVDLVNAVDASAATASARAHLDPERLAIIVVGDGAAIRTDLEKLGLGPIIERGSDGKVKSE